MAWALPVIAVATAVPARAASGAVCAGAITATSTGETSRTGIALTPAPGSPGNLAGFATGQGDNVTRWWETYQAMAGRVDNATGSTYGQSVVTTTYAGLVPGVTYTGTLNIKSNFGNQCSSCSRGAGLLVHGGETAATEQLAWVVTRTTMLYQPGIAGTSQLVAPADGCSAPNRSYSTAYTPTFSFTAGQDGTFVLQFTFYFQPRNTGTCSTGPVAGTIWANDDIGSSVPVLTC
ncbi:MAG: hypothetical protein LBU78_04325 [Microbacterium sp.]|nr:hypothetical protein [Microbacterium sp.]